MLLLRHLQGASEVSSHGEYGKPMVLVQVKSGFVMKASKLEGKGPHSPSFPGNKHEAVLLQLTRKSQL